MDLKRSNGVPASAQLRSNARNMFEHRSNQPASHAVALAGPTIPSLQAMRRGSYLHSIAECTIERIHQCDRTHGLHSNIAL
jgi:hypothetical protein